MFEHAELNRELFFFRELWHVVFLFFDLSQLMMSRLDHGLFQDLDRELAMPFLDFVEICKSVNLVTHHYSYYSNTIRPPAIPDRLTGLIGLSETANDCSHRDH
ncbi:hypothetical protein L5515_019692 [Caenorhabditis briggsae]|uniref:Uncharacterized protein n=1 Tax=Caenorhabditis briggsae TaxID=6238 RepID=A0AAE9FMA1_CAEBR|nr:hypothetical protein L5515_019692 [Caenorhabditis briggsae]